MTTLYLDLFSGISGDMFIGALLDLGVDLEALDKALGSLPLGGYHLHAGRGQRNGISGVKFEVHMVEAPGHGHHHGGASEVVHDHDAEHGHDHHEHQDFSAIAETIRSSALSNWVKEQAIAVFRRVAVAEGKIHGVPPEQARFHEVGAVDSIVDIVGACLALELLGKPRVLASSVVDGAGWVQCAHGRYPVPAPATLEILGAAGIALTQCEEPHELVTPTGAAILAQFVESFGPMRGLETRRIGYGLGSRENKARPNVLRAVLCEAASTPVSGNDWETDTVAILETNLDDINAEILGHFVELALGAGALDVYHTPIQMKKSRPGVLLTVLCPADDADRFTELMLRETTALGVRRTLAERRKLRRESRLLRTRYGDVAVKCATLNGELIQAAPEYESCRKVAAQAGVPVKHVYEAALRAHSNPPGL